MENHSNLPTNVPGMNMFIVSAILCTILSWTCSCFAPVNVVLGSLAIIFALLSKGKELKTSHAAKVTIIAAIFGMIFSVVSTVYSAYNVFHDPQAYEEFKVQYEALTGQSFEEELNTMKELYHIPDFH